MVTCLQGAFTFSQGVRLPFHKVYISLQTRTIKFFHEKKIS